MKFQYLFSSEIKSKLSSAFVVIDAFWVNNINNENIFEQNNENTGTLSQLF